MKKPTLADFLGKPIEIETVEIPPPKKPLPEGTVAPEVKPICLGPFRKVEIK